MASTLYPTRYWSTTCWHPSGTLIAYLTGSDAVDPNTWTDVVVEIAGVPTALTPPSATRWIRAAANPAGDYVLVSEAQTGGLQVYDTISASWTNVGATAANRPVAVGWNGTDFILLNQNSPTTYERRILGGAATSIPIPGSVSGTSQGILRFTAGVNAASDVIAWTDLNRSIVSGGVQINFPQFANGVYMGQGQTGGSIALLANGDLSYIPEGSADPQFSYVNGVWTFTSWIGGGGAGSVAAAVVGTFPPWPNLTPGTPIPPQPSVPTGGGIFAPSIRRGTARARVLERELPRLYHETDQIPDPITQRTARLLWDRTYDINDQIKAVDARVGEYDTRLAALEARLQEVHDLAVTASAPSGKTVSNLPVGFPVGGSTGPTAPGTEPQPPGGSIPSNLGSLSEGVNTAGPTGHVPAGSAVNFTTTGKIIVGTANEFPALLAATGSLAAREANASELLGRMIWHLQRASIPSGRQRNPSGAISKDKLTFQVGGHWYAADVFLDYDAFTVPLVVKADLVTPASTVPDGGIPD